MAENSDQAPKEPPTPGNQPTEPASGTVINSRFKLLSLLGRGGMGAVYEAYDPVMDRQIAVKLLSGKPTNSESGAGRFIQEAKVLSTLSHPNIVQVYGYDAWNEQPFMVCELLKGTSLADVLDKRTRLPEEEALKIFAKICEALTHAHHYGFIHRDLKPSNVMLCGAEPSVKLIDFGLVKLMGHTDVQALTKTGSVIGSIYYMSPEQCLSKEVDARSDIYSLGCLMYEVLAGKPPLVGNSPLATLNMQVHQNA